MKSAPITLAKLTSKRTWKVILSWVLTIAVVIGVICGVVAVVKAIDSDNRTVHSTWARGTLDEEGKYEESKEYIYTKNAFECDGLEISLDFDATIEYEVVFYDKNGDLLATNGRTGFLTGAYGGEEDTVPAGAYYARVIVKATNDDTITSLEVSKYARQITISVAK